MGYLRTIGGWPCLAAGTLAVLLVTSSAQSAQEPPHSAELDAMIIKAAKRHGVPEQLVRRIVMRESRYNPRARNHSFWGLMQISYPTAKSMGFKGTPEQLLNPITNLTYAVPYLANAFVIAGKHQDAAVRLYASGYYATAKQRGLLGALRTAESKPVVDVPEDQKPAAVAESSPGFFGSLFGSTETAQTIQPSTTVAAAAELATSAAAAPPPAGSAQTATADAATSEPSKKGLRNGGVTVLARGEQGVEHLAAYGGAKSDASSRHARGRYAHKSTEFAALDAPASAQAYAATPGDTAASAPQAAIAQALNAPYGTAGYGVPAEAPAADPAAQQQADAASDAPATTPRKKRHKAADTKHGVAKAKETQVGPVAQLRP